MNKRSNSQSTPMKITQFKNFNVPVSHLEVETVLQNIQNGSYMGAITKARNAYKSGDMALYTKEKKHLPAVTFSGRFEGGRKLEYLKEYVPIIILDIDHCSTEKIAPYLTIINSCPFTYASFISPSGEGIKILIRVDSCETEHYQAFEALKHYYERLVGVKIDQSGKDITRLCFLSHDANLFHNPHSGVFNYKTTLTTNKREYNKANNSITLSEKLYEMCLKRVIQKYGSYEKGNRNNFIFHLACDLRRVGVEMYVAKDFIMANYDLDIDEINSSVESAFKNSTKGNGGNRSKQEIDQNIDHSKEKAKKIDQKKNDKSNLISHVIIYLDALYQFRHNEVTGHIEYRMGETSRFENINDKVLNNIWCELQQAGIKIRKDDLRTIIHSDYAPYFNPFIDYFTTLPKWDQTVDYIAQLANTIEVKPEVKAHWELSLKKWIVALVGCAIDKNVVNQTVLSISGLQGKGKTTWIERLMPKSLNSYLLTGRISARDKDSLVFLSDCLLINLDELDKMNQHDLNSLKSLITRTAIKLRKPYDKYSSNEPRRASFAGSTNCTNFLTDPTGNRRFLCFESIHINFNHNVNLDLVYSQAYHLFKSGFRYWFDATEQLELEKMNSSFTETTKEEELFLTYFDVVKSDAIDKYKKRSMPHSLASSQGGLLRLTATEIASRLMDKTRMNITCTPVELGKILNRIGAIGTTAKGRRTYLVYEKLWNEVDEKQRLIEECV